ncbi:MAG: hypothetical protein ACKORF_00230 [Micrococcales bacterium]
MLSRKFAAIAVAATLVLTTAGCSFNPAPESLQSYAPADGSGVDLELGKGEVLKLRDFLYLTDGTNGNLFGTLANSGSADVMLELQQDLADGTKYRERVVIPGGAVLNVGEGNAQSGIKVTLPAGAVFPIFVSADNGNNWQKLNVPVLDDTFAQYRDKVAGLAPTATPVATDTPTDAATPSPTAEATN